MFDKLQLLNTAGHQLQLYCQIPKDGTELCLVLLIQFFQIFHDSIKHIILDIILFKLTFCNCKKT